VRSEQTVATSIEHRRDISSCLEMSNTYCRLKKAVQEINKKGHEFNCQIVLKKLLTFLSVCWMTSSYVALFAPESSTEFMLIYVNWWNNCLFRFFFKSIRYFEHFIK